jgi:hypothetical protein
LDLTEGKRIVHSEIQAVAVTPLGVTLAWSTLIAVEYRAVYRDTPGNRLANAPGGRATLSESQTAFGRFC